MSKLRPLALHSPTTETPIVDLRSDTLTLPTPEMYEAMVRAPVADDSLDGDPTARALEAMSAERLGKEAGLFLPTCTMANLVALLVQAPRNSRILCGATSHIMRAEQGGLSLIGCGQSPIPDPLGALDAAALEEQLVARTSHLIPGIVSMETSHNDAGGLVATIEQMAEVKALARAKGVPVHLDGARIFNAATWLGIDAARIAEYADTVSICLSKGLSAPAGAVLVGDAAVIAAARVRRRMLGGQQRQIGVLAAAGQVALETMVDRLAEDHANTATLARRLAELAPALGVSEPQTNILQVDLSNTGRSATEWIAALNKHGVLVRPMGALKLRLVINRHVSAPMVEDAAHAFANVLSA